MKRLFSHYARATSFFLIIAASFLFLTAATARGQVLTFLHNKTMNYPAGTIPAFIGTGDFDGDGNLDLAVVNAGSDNVSILLGNGDGTFDAPVNFRTGAVCTTPPAPCLQPTSVAVGNFDVDSKLDLAITNFATNEVVILINTTPGIGTPTFGPPTSFPVGNGPLFVTAGDFDADGFLDLAVANTGHNPSSAPVGTTVSILNGDGAGGFPTITPVTVGQGPVSIALGHFNAGPELDFAVANFVDNTVSVFLGVGDAINFNQATGSPITVGTHPISIATEDFNGDSIDDLAVASQAGKSISILLGVGDAGGTFSPVKKLAIGKTLSELVVGDFNGDSAPDIAFSSFPGHALGVILGNGDGTFTSKIKAFKTTAKGTGLFSIAAGNFNAGSLPDLAIPNGQVSILLNTTTPPPVGASFTVVSPNGGGSLTIGSTVPITWTSTGFIASDTVKIDYFDGTTWKAVIKSTPNLGSRLWKVPKSPTAAALIRICSVNYPGICDQSDGVFTIGP